MREPCFMPACIYQEHIEMKHRQNANQAHKQEGTCSTDIRLSHLVQSCLWQLTEACFILYPDLAAVGLVSL